MTYRLLVAPLLAASILAADAAAQEETTRTRQTVSVRWLAFRGSVEIPRAEAEPYVLRVEIPEQMIVGGRVRAVLRGPDPESAPVAAYGRFELTADAARVEEPSPSSSGGSDVAMESLQLVAEGLRIEPPRQANKEDWVMILAYSHEVSSPRDAAPKSNSQVVIPLPDPLREHIGF